jgi:hypothetical protein
MRILYYRRSQLSSSFDVKADSVKQFNEWKDSFMNDTSIYLKIVEQKRHADGEF